MVARRVRMVRAQPEECFMNNTDSKIPHTVTVAFTVDLFGADQAQYIVNGLAAQARTAYNGPATSIADLRLISVEVDADALNARTAAVLDSLVRATERAQAILASVQQQESQPVSA
jgi:hypothetical protein